MLIARSYSRAACAAFRRHVGGRLSPRARSAQAYPAKPVKLIVGFPPGGGSDALARLLAAALTDKLGQQVLVDNKAGANTIVGTEFVKSQPPDGYTLLFVSASFAINPSLYKLTYDIEKDFTPVAIVAIVPLLLIVNNDSPAKSVKDLIAMAKAQPGKLTYASFGAGSAAHLAGEMFLGMTGTNMIHVPYKGSAPAVIDVMGGRVTMMLPGHRLGDQSREGRQVAGARGLDGEARVRRAGYSHHRGIGRSGLRRRDVGIDPGARRHARRRDRKAQHRDPRSRRDARAAPEDDQSRFRARRDEIAGRGRAVREKRTQQVGDRGQGTQDHGRVDAMSSPHVTVIGAGIVGVSAAAWLQKAGFDVTIVDSEPVGHGASFGNAGNVSPGAVVPYTLPGVLRSLPGWLLDPEGPLAVRPSALLRGAAVAARCREEQHGRSGAQDLARDAARCMRGTFEAYDALTLGTDAAGLIERSGQLYVSEKPDGAQGSQLARRMREEAGVKVTALSESEIRDIEPALAPIFRSGMLLPDNGRCKNPHALVQAIAGECERNGATIVRGTVDGFETNGKCVNGIVVGGKVDARRACRDRRGRRFREAHREARHAHPRHTGARLSHHDRRSGRRAAHAGVERRREVRVPRP